MALTTEHVRVVDEAPAPAQPTRQPIRSRPPVLGWIVAVGGVAAAAALAVAVFGADSTSTRPQGWGDVKDHPGYGPVVVAESAAGWSGDVKDHPGYGPVVVVESPAGWSGDAKDHPGYGPTP